MPVHTCSCVLPLGFKEVFDARCCKVSHFSGCTPICWQNDSGRILGNHVSDTYVCLMDIAGGSEQAFMSITSDIGVAVDYALGSGSSSLLFKIKVEQFADHGAGERYYICVYEHNKC
jgi:hypothetical protein